MTRARAALARHASEMPEQPAVVYVDPHGHWKWRSWRWLADEVERAVPGVGAESEWAPTVEAVVAVLAHEPEQMVRGAHPTGARALDVGERPVVPVVHDPAEPHAAAWLLWALEAGAALVVPGDEAFLAWAIWWPRATDAAVYAHELAPLREVLSGFGSRRAQRRHLARLRRLVVWGESPSYAERAWWDDLGIPLQEIAIT